MPIKLPFTYANPHLDVEPGIVRDPFIVKLGETYYLTGTLRPIWAGPNPGVPLWSSPDLLIRIMQFNGKDSPERLAYDPIWFNTDGWIETNAPTLGTQIAH